VPKPLFEKPQVRMSTPRPFYMGAPPGHLCAVLQNALKVVKHNHGKGYFSVSMGQASRPYNSIIRFIYVTIIFD